MLPIDPCVRQPKLEESTSTHSVNNGESDLESGERHRTSNISKNDIVHKKEKGEDEMVDEIDIDSNSDLVLAAADGNKTYDKQSELVDSVGDMVKYDGQTSDGEHKLKHWRTTCNPNN